MWRPTPTLAFVAATVLHVVGCADPVATRLPAAEAAGACAGISDAQSQDLFTSLRDAVESVDVVREPTTAKATVTRSLGADIHVRPREGLTAQWLRRLAKCHAQREMAGASCTSGACPLGLARTTTTIETTPAGFTIALRSDDPEVAQEIGRRAQLLVQPLARGAH